VPPAQNNDIQCQNTRAATRGRPPATTAEEISHVALELFARDGFEQTTMDDVAAALGVGRRTVFRYFASKNDLVWGDFGAVLRRLQDEFDATDPRAPLTAALRDAVVASNTYPPSVLPELRLRLTLITTVPALQAHSMLRYAEWREVVARFAARRTRRSPQHLVPQALGYAALAASTSAFAHWVEHPGEDLVKLLRRSYDLLAAGFGETEIRRRVQTK
jgi:TetR/AcrR family transcriptional regulator, regulator of mycofactocin system